MAVVSVEPDLEQHTLTAVVHLDAPVERVWQLWSDPRRLERWWGPPGYPATVRDHDLTPGGRVRYFMTSPEGEKLPGWWRVDEVEVPNHLAFTDGFADDAFEPVEDMPAGRSDVRLSEHDGGTELRWVTRYDTREALEQIVGMGAVEGTRQALEQMDSVLG
ncbi:SRPBCC domain-containing protein [Aeromicrobium sp. IC_218]|uniref:SRPBCC family protein n=1 Tax=Aeromicrobium sp. IC_218 TaxID=2545468 RepID=UPI001038ECD9|nr:SRPBCC domain-containing protein [Aeromicrobium sp. IC_218]TCI98971.1 SRPBCC domain-containing protein [Aeromicrobium sp. IC_218]